MFKGFKAVGGAGVACKDNNKVVRCSNNGVTGGVGCDDRLVVVLDKIRESGIEKTPTRALPQTKSPTL